MAPKARERALAAEVGPWPKAARLPGARAAVVIYPDPAPHRTHLSSLFLQMHSPIISLISGSCTFSKLAGLMPCKTRGPESPTGQDLFPARSGALTCPEEGRRGTSWLGTQLTPSPEEGLSEAAGSGEEPDPAPA